MSHVRLPSWPGFALLVALIATMVPLGTPPTLAAPSPYTRATVAGSFQSALGCTENWQPSCALTDLTYNEPAGVYVGQFAVPAGPQSYKVAVNGSWDVSFGTPSGGNLDLTAPGGDVRFFFDPRNGWVGDSVRKVYTVPGDFNSEVGCGGDWAPDCLVTLMSDPDGDGVFTFATDAVPAGSYQFKVATNESWSNPNYGQGGGDANIPFTVAGPSTVTFSFNSATSTPTVSVQSSLPQPDNNVEWDGLAHDSRATLYRTPGGAVPVGTPVTLRFRTLHNDVTGVTLRVYDVNANGERFVPMELAASNVDCYQESLAGKACDFWAATVTQDNPNNLWYRFVVTDGTDTDYYGDNTAALDGGLGAVSDDPVDRSYALMFHDPAFRSPNWAKTAVIYQIFPDRFRNGDTRNDPQDGDIRYDDPVITLDWGTLPEGYCRNYADAATNCPWRFDATPPATSPDKESPRGRDYYGGDLKGVTQQLDYLKRMGVSVIYFNPIFAAGSNHRYDTRDYYAIDPYLGELKDFRQLVQAAERRGIRVVLDSVFNHMSSDSPLFDRYSHYSTLGACESLSSPYRGWFNFRTANVPCGSDDYVGWFGFDSIPEIDKRNPAVQDYFLTAPNSVSRYWLRQGAAGWRLDVMGDASFPAGYWETFRDITRDTRHDSLIIGELWQKDTTLLRHLRGETADTTMNYRLRDAVIGFLTPGPFDSKGFGDSGRVISAEEFAERVRSIREDYPDAAYYTLMNLLGSHDTERILWTLTPGAETIAEKELNATNVAAGKRRLAVASLIQFTMPGAPTVYYGDEVGVTGDDDPDDRRTYPWAAQGGSPDNSLYEHYRELAKQRDYYTALTRGDLRVLLASGDALAYSRVSGNDAALVAVNRSAATSTLRIPVAGHLPDGTRLQVAYCVGNEQIALWHDVKDGALTITLEPMSAALLTSYQADLTAPRAPGSLAATAGEGRVDLSWGAVGGAAGYNLYRSPLSGGGFVQLNAAPIAGTSYADTGVENGRLYYYVVKAVDRKGNESAASAEASALPALVIDWANLQWPPTISHTISAINRTAAIYGQVYVEGATNTPGATPGLRAQVGYGPAGSSPSGGGWIWVDATFNVQAGNNDEFQATLLPDTVGSFDYVYRYSTTGGRDWLYADLSGPVSGSPGSPGRLTVSSSGDTTAPATPANLRVTSASPAGIALAWDAVADTYGYEVARATAAAGPFTVLALTTAAGFTDTAVSQGATYYYQVRAVDESFNRSAYTAPIQATAALRTVTLTFNVTVPASTDATGRGVYIAGFLDRLDGGLPQWNPGGVVLTRVSPTRWTITFTGREATQIEYKYALGSWDYVEKGPGAACAELPNRQLTLSYGADGNQVVDDTIDNWRNVAPCGN